MKIVIVGAGKVGYSLAQRLIQDDHDVYVIDRSPERIHNLENTLDVSLEMCIRDRYSGIGNTIIYRCRGRRFNKST